jgi:tetratricopeptide (TPR) repeat protein
MEHPVVSGLTSLTRFSILEDVHRLSDFPGKPVFPKPDDVNGPQTTGAPMNRIRPFLLFFFAWLWVAPAWAVDTEILIAQGIDKIAVQDYAGAAERLEQALASDPDNAEACYYAGLAYSRMGEPAKAEPLLQRARTLDPGSANVHFELGLLYARLSDCPRASDAFETFRQISPSDDRNAEVTDLMKNCQGVPEDTFLEKAQVRLDAGLGGNYDTNVTLEPGNPVGPKDRRPDFSGILFLSAGLVPLQTDLVRLNLDYDFFQSFHVEESGFNVDFNKISPSLSFRLWDRLVPSVGYVFENTLLGWDTYGRVNEAYGKTTLEWGKGLFTDLRYSYRNQTYWNTTLFPTNAIRTGYSQSVELRQFVSWNGIDFQVYGLGDFDRAKADWWSYDGFRFGLEAAFRVWVLNIGLGAAYTERHYQGVYPDPLNLLLYHRNRLDREQEYSAAVTYMIVPWLSATLINTTVICNSNIEYLFGYDRNITGIFLAAGLP